MVYVDFFRNGFGRESNWVLYTGYLAPKSVFLEVFLMAKNAQVMSVYALRERLRTQSEEIAEKLRRSVARQTSYDSLPCDDYLDTVHDQQKLMQRLAYIQYCRAMVERCILKGGAIMKFYNGGPEPVITKFYRVKPGQIQVINLQL